MHTAGCSENPSISPRYHGEIAVDTLLLPELVLLCRDHHCDSADDVGTGEMKCGICIPIEMRKGQAKSELVCNGSMGIAWYSTFDHANRDFFSPGEPGLPCQPMIPSLDCPLMVCKPQGLQICATMENKIQWPMNWLGWNWVFPRCRISSK